MHYIVVVGQLWGNQDHDAFSFFNGDAQTQVAVLPQHLLKDLARHVLVKVEWELSRSSLAC